MLFSGVIAHMGLSFCGGGLVELVLEVAMALCFKMLEWWWWMYRLRWRFYLINREIVQIYLSKKEEEVLT